MVTEQNGMRTGLGRDEDGAFAVRRYGRKSTENFTLARFH